MCFTYVYACMLTAPYVSVGAGGSQGINEDKLSVSSGDSRNGVQGRPSYSKTKKGGSNSSTYETL